MTWCWETEFEDKDLLTDLDYVEAVMEDYGERQDGMFAEFCSMIVYYLGRY